jgi:hypothetical protein
MWRIPVRYASLRGLIKELRRGQLLLKHDDTQKLALGPVYHPSLPTLHFSLLTLHFLLKTILVACSHALRRPATKELHRQQLHILLDDSNRHAAIIPHS